MRPAGTDLEMASTSCLAPADSAAAAATAAPTATNTSPATNTAGRRLPAGDSRGGFDDLKPLLAAAGVEDRLMSSSPSRDPPITAQ